VPVLWDLERATIVSNESSDIIRMLNSAFDDIGALAGDYAPAELLPAIDALNARIYDTVNNGVYKAGFATDQAVYEREVAALFRTLDELEARLAGQRYLLGDRVTEADWRLFTTLIRFDAVYHGHFKCNLRRLADYPNLWAYTRELYQWPGVAGTVDFTHIKQHYYRSHPSINPNGIVPAGPLLALDEPHRRG
jgi:putative glutathione S-transferase